MNKIQSIICFVLGSSIASEFDVPLRPYILSKVCKEPFKKCKPCKDPVNTEQGCHFVSRIQAFTHGKNVVYAKPIPGDSAHLVVYGCVWDTITYIESNKRNGTIYMYFNPAGRALSADPNIRQVCYDPTVVPTNTTTDLTTIPSATPTIITTVETTTTEAIMRYQESEGQGCCIKPGLGAAVYHRYCLCQAMSVNHDVPSAADECKSRCTRDNDCKGYFMEYNYCNLATTARYCPNNCGNPIHPRHVAELDLKATCNWDAGPCYIKEKLPTSPTTDLTTIPSATPTIITTVKTTTTKTVVPTNPTTDLTTTPAATHHTIITTVETTTTEAVVPTNPTSDTSTIPSSTPTIITTVETTTTEAIIRYRESEGEACCTSKRHKSHDEVYHKYCACGSPTVWECNNDRKCATKECIKKCTKDPDCKGAFMEYSYCNLATTARYCPNDCPLYVYDNVTNNVAELDPKATCNHKIWEYVSPCYIKQK
jgi:hypothetical protein